MLARKRVAQTSIEYYYKWYARFWLRREADSRWDDNTIRRGAYR